MDLLLEYIKGGQLKDRGKLKEQQARMITRQIVSALDYLHSNNIAHLRLCAENILVTKTGDTKPLIKSGYRRYEPTLGYEHPEGLPANPVSVSVIDVEDLGYLVLRMLGGKTMLGLNYRRVITWPTQIGSDSGRLQITLNVVFTWDYSLIPVRD